MPDDAFNSESGPESGPDSPPKHVTLIATDRIRILNPRVRNRRTFEEMIDSIARIGLKRPITVAQRPDSDPVEYDLVCGQGRLEAFLELKQSEIPAIIINANESDCLVMSLVENCARRQHRAIDLMREIGELRKRGYPGRDGPTSSFRSSHPRRDCDFLGVAPGAGKPRFLARILARHGYQDTQPDCRRTRRSRTIGGAFRCSGRRASSGHFQNLRWGRMVRGSSLSCCQRWWQGGARVPRLPGSRPGTTRYMVAALRQDLPCA